MLKYEEIPLDEATLHPLPTEAGSSTAAASMNTIIKIEKTNTGGIQHWSDAKYQRRVYGYRRRSEKKQDEFHECVKANWENDAENHSSVSKSLRATYRKIHVVWWPNLGSDWSWGYWQGYPFSARFHATTGHLRSNTPESATGYQNQESHRS